MRILLVVALNFLLFAFYISSVYAACETQSYRSYAEINGSLSTLSAKNTVFARVFTIGTTAEGRGIQAILITKDANNASGSGPTLTTGKPAVVITGGIHADEWPVSRSPWGKGVFSDMGT